MASEVEEIKELEELERRVESLEKEAGIGQWLRGGGGAGSRNMWVTV